MMMRVEIIPWNISVWNVIFDEKVIKLFSFSFFFLLFSQQVDTEISNASFIVYTFTKKSMNLPLTRSLNLKALVTIGNYSK